MPIQLRYHHTLITLFISLASILRRCHSTVTCSIEDGGGICPEGAKCCKIIGRDGSIASGCIPHNPHIKGDGVCCHDDYADTHHNGIALGSACAGNYKCDSNTVEHDDDRGVHYFCSLRQKQGHGNATKVTTMPRYTLVKSSIVQLTMYGFPIMKKNMLNFPAAAAAGAIDRQPPVVAYYSNMQFTTPSSTEGDVPIPDEHIQAVIIVVHGSDRNADEYLYSAMTVAQIQSKYHPDNILIVAPRFLVVEDGVESIPVKIGSSVKMMQPLMWNETYPIPHTWRYGANALPPWSDLSSYDVMDVMVEHFALNSGNSGRWKKLERIAVIGHSAGGQFVHRWALTSNSEAWVDRNFGMKGIDTSAASSLRRLSNDNIQNNNIGLPSIRVVVANPRSFCYLDNRRIINGTSQIPPLSMREACPNYNKWEWGLDEGGELFTPYKDRALQFFNGDTSKLSHRYANRDVVYLAGKNDTERLHGSCEDDGFQGRFRRERSLNYMKSLRHYFGSNVHSRKVVDEVGHDHSLIFQSEEGLEAIFE